MTKFHGIFISQKMTLSLGGEDDDKQDPLAFDTLNESNNTNMWRVFL